jgi:uncharacterized membrane protein YgcG
MPNLLRDMPFLPATAPSSSVVDCAHILSPANLSQLNAQAGQVHFKPYIVILPSNYVPASMMQTSSNIAQQWQMPSNAFLMVINLSGHNLRITPGPTLRNEGLTDSKIEKIIATKFGPPMRTTVRSHGPLSSALPDAISSTIDGVNETLGYKSVSQAVETKNAPASTCNTHGGFCFIGPVLAIAAVILIYKYIKGRKQ